MLVDPLRGGQVDGYSSYVPPYTYRTAARNLDNIESLIVDAGKLWKLRLADGRRVFRFSITSSGFCWTRSSIFS
ncbi:MAG: hypothetical protein ACK2UE_08450 [Anaerolineales bacterium]